MSAEESQVATRRLVTGVNTEEKSCLVHDGPTPGRIKLLMGITWDEIWVNDPANPDPTANNDPARDDMFHLLPPANGSRCCVVTFSPEPEGWEPTYTEEEIAAVTSRYDTDGVFGEDPWMHTTPTIDYGIVLSGEIDLELDEGIVRVGPGDVVVQRGTLHGWHNRGTEPCRVAFVLISSPNYR